MKRSHKPYIKTIEILREIKSYIENNYDISDCNLFEDTEEIVYSKFNFKLKTPYYDVPIEIRRDYNYKPTIWLSISFKNERKQRKGGNITGYCHIVYNASDDNKVDFKETIDYDSIDKEFQYILNNIKGDGTWCDESKHDD